MNLDRYVLLGRSGLRVSPLALGTMTFGNMWGSNPLSRETAQGIFDTYLDAGGNFIDTADLYTGGTSEQWVGGFVKARGLRDRVVIATKYSYNTEPGNPNAGGNQRKNLMRALEASLKRLQTDYIDLYYLHTWDRLTPVDEVMRTMDDAVRAGKIRHVGLSDIPAWYAARAQTMAQWRCFEPVAAMQMQYSLIERNIELEFADLAVELGMGLVPWSPLGMGLLSGKYRRGDAESTGGGRLRAKPGEALPSFIAQFLNDRNFMIADTLRGVSEQAGVTMVQAALSWLLHRRGVSSVIVGASKVAQLEDSIGSMKVVLTPEQIKALDVASEPARAFPYGLFTDQYQPLLAGGVHVSSQSADYARPTLVPAVAG